MTPCAASIEEMPEDPYNDLVISLLKVLSGNRYSFYSDAPKQIEIIQFDSPENNCGYISFVNIQDAFPVLPVHHFNTKISLDGKKVKKLLLLPSETEIAFSVENGCLIIDMEYINMLQMLKVIYE